VLASPIVARKFNSQPPFKRSPAAELAIKIMISCAIVPSYTIFIELKQELVAFFLEGGSIIKNPYYHFTLSYNKLAKARKVIE
jgi:hypothetical protein